MTMLRTTSPAAAGWLNACVSGFEALYQGSGSRYSCMYNTTLYGSSPSPRCCPGPPLLSSPARRLSGKCFLALGASVLPPQDKKAGNPSATPRNAPAWKSPNKAELTKLCQPSVNLPLSLGQQPHHANLVQRAVFILAFENDRLEKTHL